jgi:hypothetical protein
MTPDKRQHPTSEEKTVTKIGCWAAFWGDTRSAVAQLLRVDDLDYLVADYLAEITMALLARARAKDPEAGFVPDAITSLQPHLAEISERGIKVVTNAGGLDPAGLTARLHEVARGLGLSPRIAHLEGDDLLGRLDGLQSAGHPLTHLNTGRPLSDAPATPMTANAYLGGWGIADALAGGADVVVCPRVTDAALVVGPAAWATSSSAVRRPRAATTASSPS